MEVDVDEVVTGQNVGIQGAGPGQQPGCPGRVGGDRFVQAESRAAAAQIQRKLGEIGAGEQTGAPLAEGEHLIDECPVDGLGRRAGEALLHHDGESVDLRDHLVPCGR
jgi:hypothetical protein